MNIKNVKVKRIRQRRHSTDSNDSGADQSESDEEQEFQHDEENAELPVISNDGYYWIGKDYSNCYVADFKDIADFSRGEQYHL